MTHEQKAKDAIIESVNWLHCVPTEHRALAFATLAQAEATLAVAAAYSRANLAAPTVPAASETRLYGPHSGPKNAAELRKPSTVPGPPETYSLSYGHSQDAMRHETGFRVINVVSSRFAELVLQGFPYVLLSLIDEHGSHTVAKYDLQLF